jgi:hypothetical protein
LLAPTPRPVWTLVRIGSLVVVTSAMIAVVLAVILMAAYALATTLQGG